MQDCVGNELVVGTRICYFPRGKNNSAMKFGTVTKIKGNGIQVKRKYKKWHYYASPANRWSIAEIKICLFSNSYNAPIKSISSVMAISEDQFQKGDSCVRI